MLIFVYFNICFRSSSNEPLTIRKYLDLHEQCLRLFNFSDPWKDQKAIENDFAIMRLKERLSEIDKLEADERWLEIAKGMLAGTCNLEVTVTRTK